MDRSALRRSGLTLMELLVVLAILVALAGVVIPLLTNQVSSSQLDATYKSMLAIRQAIMGTPGYFPDTKGLSGGPYFTRTSPTAATVVADAAGMPATLNDLFVNPGFAMANGSAFDPLSQKGWRGPYLNQTMGALNTTVTTTGGTTTTTTTVLNSFPPPTGSTTPNQIWLEWPGNPAGTTATDVSLDGIPSSQVYMYFRLRTPGLSGKLVNPTTNVWIPSSLTPSTYGDNLILYIRLDIPGIDWTNYYNLKQTLGN